MADIDSPDHGSAEDRHATQDLDATQESLGTTISAVTRRMLPGEDRRACPRFPLKLAVTCRIGGSHPAAALVGETLNISSAGLLFAAEATFVPGQRVQVMVDWPARLNGRIPLFLVLDGRILRCGNGQVAMLVRRHEFRTRSVALVH